MPTGTVKWYHTTKGFGFITPEEPGDDIFVHSTNIKDGGTLSDGQEVTYEIGDGRKGPEAKNVEPK